MKIRNIIIGISITVAISSCENILETDFPVNQINSVHVFESVSTADGALSSMYADVQNNSVISGGSFGTGALLGSYTDDLNCYILNSTNSALDIFNNQQLATNTTIKTVWSNAYKQIYMANSIIEGINTSSVISSQEKDRIRAEALFIRSLEYFYLTQIFGAIPYVTTTDYNQNMIMGKTDTKEILDRIKQDLESLIPNLKDEYRNVERIYPNRKSAELLYAYVLSLQQKWSEAETVLKSIIQSPLYSFETNIAKTFKKGGKHILWQLKPLKNGDATQEASLYTFTTAVPYNYALSSQLVSAFADNDLRKQNWIKEIVINQKSFFRNDKYKNTLNNTDEYSIVFRLEEVYLLMAEVLAQQTKTSESSIFLNAVRQKAGLNSLSGDLPKDILLEEIVQESRREFFAEKGTRFLTLKRLNKLSHLEQVKYNWKTFHELWGIPLSEILINPNLKPQNPGY